MNHFYKYDTQHIQRTKLDGTLTLKQEWHPHIKERYTVVSPQSNSLSNQTTCLISNQPERSGHGCPAIYPFLHYFVAFDRPDRIYTIGKDKSLPACKKLSSEVRDIVGGTSLQGVIGEHKVESLILLPKNQNTLITSQMTRDGAGVPSKGLKLKLGYNYKEDAIAVLNTDAGYYIVVVHKDGMLERRRVSNT
jgi:hypothetical protein